MQSGSSHKGAKISWSLLSVGKVIHRLLDITYVDKKLSSSLTRGLVWGKLFSQAGGSPRFMARRVPHCTMRCSGGGSSGFQCCPHFVLICDSSWRSPPCRSIDIVVAAASVWRLKGPVACAWGQRWCWLSLGCKVGLPWFLDSSSMS